jgi:hypothetical protein
MILRGSGRAKQEAGHADRNEGDMSLITIVLDHPETHTVV